MGIDPGNVVRGAELVLSPSEQCIFSGDRVPLLASESGSRYPPTRVSPSITLSPDINTLPLSTKHMSSRLVQFV
jgi:hypothetical protein